MSRNPKNKIRLAPFVAFAIFLFAALTLLTVALTIYVGGLLGCMALGALAVGGFYLILAVIVYFAGVRPVMRRIDTLIDIVDDLIHAADDLRRWVSNLGSTLLGMIAGRFLRR